MDEPKRSRKAAALLNALVLVTLFVACTGVATMMLGSKSNATFSRIQGTAPTPTSR